MGVLSVLAVVFVLVISMAAVPAMAVPQTAADGGGAAVATPTAATLATPSETQPGDRGCTMVIVGKDASADGSVLIARTEDYAGGWAKHFVVNPAETHEPGARIEAYSNDMSWPLPAQTYKYISAQDWTTKWGRFHEFAINSEGVAVTATTTTSLNEKAAAVDPLVDDGLTEAFVTTLVAQRAATPREGVELVGEIVETNGTSESFGMAVANGSEAWLIEVGGGSHWVAARIPDDEYFVGANALRIGEVDLDSPDYMGSADLISFAAENDLYNPKAEEFDYAEAYGTADDYAAYNYRRVWGGITFFGVEDPPWPGNSDRIPNPKAHTYPLTLEPAEPISVADVMAFQRYHYDGTRYDVVTDKEPLERPIGTPATIEAHVLQMRAEGPDPISDVAWVSMSTPLGSPYVPYYPAMDSFPEEYRQGTSSWDAESAYWQFRSVANLMFFDYSEFNATYVRPQLTEFERTQFQNQQQVEAHARTLWEKNETAATEYIASYSTDRSYDALDLSYELRRQMHTNISYRGWEDLNR